MADSRNIKQFQRNVSIPREALLDKIEETVDDLKKIDYQVFLVLLCSYKIEGFTIPDGHMTDQRYEDPMNYTIIDMNTIADKIGVKRKEVKRSLERLEDAGIIQKGVVSYTSKGINNKNESVHIDGYRFLI